MAGLLPQWSALCIAPIMEEAAKAYEKPIALIGLMGAGKSTVGRRLARRIGLPFVDADQEIETAAGMSIAEIFERRVLARLVAGPPRVIATGGGAFMNDVTRALILERCIAIWLDAGIEMLAERVGRRDHRPLLKGKDPRILLQGLAETRGPVYAQAHLTVRGGAMPHEKMVDRILAALAAR